MARHGTRRRTSNTAAADARSRWVRWLALLAAFQLTALLLYAPVIGAPMFSDDNLYTVGNPWITAFSLKGLGEILDPSSGASTLVLNYSPVNLVLHAVTFAWFGRSPHGHHVVNVVLHALVSALLIVLLVRAGIAERVAVFGGLLFLVHPANVEAVAWASQLKTTASSLFAFTALILLDRRPAFATVAFLLALLTKSLAAFALPVAAVWLWTRGRRGGGLDRRLLRWLGVWALLFVAVAIAQFTALLNASLGVEYPDSGATVILRSSVALAMRYLAMATTSYGLSAFHEPPPVTSWLDPWWLAGVVALPVLGARALWALRAEREEAAWWIWAAVAFLPVSQVFPFQFAMADRYLYMMLPGLIGALGLAAANLPVRRISGQRAIAAGVIAMTAVFTLFGVRSFQRIQLWKDPRLLLVESHANYPQGMGAATARAARAAATGDLDLAMEILKSAQERGVLQVSLIASNPSFAKLHGRADYREIVDGWAARWIDKYRGYDSLTQFQLLSLGMAHEVRRERSQARRAFERGLAEGGVYDAMLRQKLAALGY